MRFNFSTLQKPIIQAPMAGGINTPELVSAVANAGGVGSFGFAYSSPQKINEDLVATKSLTKGPINANFFIFQEVELPSEEKQLECVNALARLPIVGKMVLPIPKPPFYPALEPMLEPIWIHRPALLTFHFGIPPLSVIEKAHVLGIAVGVTATSIEEAELIQKSNIDFVIAQGIEAGGHRGTFDPQQQDLLLPIDELLQSIVKKVSIPVVAAGGIMDGGDIKRMMDLGATAVQMGTAFIGCQESGASPAHKTYLLQKQDRGTSFTKSFSGRLAQGINNQFIGMMKDQPYLPFPIQNTLTGPIRQLAVKLNDGEFQSLWAGKAYSKTRALKVCELMEVLDKEFSEANVQKYLG
jgi:nitronate monooxygenase